MAGVERIRQVIGILVGQPEADFEGKQGAGARADLEVVRDEHGVGGSAQGLTSPCSGNDCGDRGKQLIPLPALPCPTRGRQGRSSAPGSHRQFHGRRLLGSHWLDERPVVLVPPTSVGRAPGVCSSVSWWAQRPSRAISCACGPPRRKLGVAGILRVDISALAGPMRARDRG